MSRQAVKVQIFNQSYSLLVDGEPADVQHLAHEIDELMYSISSRSPGDSTRVAVLACLHLADKLRAAEKQLQAFEDKSERIATLLAEALEEQAEAEEALEEA
jgi:cell division protein ZapA